MCYDLWKAGSLAHFPSQSVCQKKSWVIYQSWLYNFQPKLAQRLSRPYSVQRAALWQTLKRVLWEQITLSFKELSSSCVRAQVTQSVYIFFRLPFQLYMFEPYFACLLITILIHYVTLSLTRQHPTTTLSNYILLQYEYNIWHPF